MNYKVGLPGFGKTGKAAANVILQNQEFSWKWDFRQDSLLENRIVPEFSGKDFDELDKIYLLATTNLNDLSDEQTAFGNGALSMVKTM